MTSQITSIGAVSCHYLKFYSVDCLIIRRISLLLPNIHCTSQKCASAIELLLKPALIFINTEGMYGFMVAAGLRGSGTIKIDEIESSKFVLRVAMLPRSSQGMFG